MSASDRDQYEAYYAAKLWGLLPEVYRAADSEDATKAGPLRELVSRLGGQMAVVRRSIDRMWEDQAIETCDDWVIPYIGDLLGTNLVASLDARGQRLDVANTIYYRRRKGTVGLLEELAHDITGWDAQLGEMFRRLARTRHGFDPPIGMPAESSDPEGALRLQIAQGLTGAGTGTPAGGFADLRRRAGVGRAGSAFDELFYTADVRLGRGRTGWYGIMHLGVFLWRLESIPIRVAVPVRDKACPNQYTFDPTGRDVPLFARSTKAYGDHAARGREENMPGPISGRLLRDALTSLYPSSLSISEEDGGLFREIAVGLVTAEPRRVEEGDGEAARFFIAPERGRLYVLAPRRIEPTEHVHGSGAPILVDREGLHAPRPETEVPTRAPETEVPSRAPETEVPSRAPEPEVSRDSQGFEPELRVAYHYGFASSIGAGGYDRRAGRGAVPSYAGTSVTAQGGGSLPASPETGTLTITDSLTYGAAQDTEVGEDLAPDDETSDPGGLTIEAGEEERPVLRLLGQGEWVLRGRKNAGLFLDGLWLAGGATLVLDGDFGTVLIDACTLDPGTWDAKTGTFALAADGRSLAPSRLRIRGHVDRLEIRRSIVGPIVTEAGSSVDVVHIEDSVVQSLGSERALDIGAGDVELVRATVIGRMRAHRLYSSDAILAGRATVADAQNGCVRFSAWTAQSKLPRQFESVMVPERAELFVSTALGDPHFATLLATLDEAILAGSEAGSEMGAFCREKRPIKEKSLLIKYREYMPIGLTPVLVYVT